MKRFRKNTVNIKGLCIATLIGNAISAPLMAQQSQSDLLNKYLSEIEQLISANNLQGARDKLAEANAADLQDESLEMINSQLRLLESLNSSNRPAKDGTLTAQDTLAATDLLDSLRVAIENGELSKVQTFSEASPKINSLLSAVFDNYTALKVRVSEPEPDNETRSFLATLEFTELTTKDGNTAFPAQGWKTHRLRIIKTEGKWQKVLW